jgi:hypothetical protein
VLIGQAECCRTGYLRHQAGEDCIARRQPPSSLGPLSLLLRPPIYLGYSIPAATSETDLLALNLPTLSRTGQSSLLPIQPMARALSNHDLPAPTGRNLDQGLQRQQLAARPYTCMPLMDGGTSARSRTTIFARSWKNLPSVFSRLAFRTGRDEIATSR